MTPAEHPPHMAASVAPRKEIFVVEDHPIFRRGLIGLLESQPGLHVCGWAASSPCALDQLRQVRADAVVLDVAIEGANGLELLKHLRAEHPHLALLVLSMHDESVYGLRALRAGASGYVMKRETDDVLLKALRQVLAGEVFVSAALSRELIYRVARHDDTASQSPIAALSDRELEVMALIGQGQSTRNIADSLHISIKTVESHRLHMKEKLGLPHASDLIRFAVQWVEEQRGL